VMVRRFGCDSATWRYAGKGQGRVQGIDLGLLATLTVRQSGKWCKR
jgi:hypothetical protein